MKILLSLIILFIPFSILAKQICLAPSGCSIEMDTGLCPNCIEVKEEPPIIKEEKVIVEKKPVVKVSNPPLYPRVNESLGNKVKTNKKKGVCYVKPCDCLNPPSKVSLYEGIKPNKLTKNKRPRTRERNCVGTLFKKKNPSKFSFIFWRFI